MCTRTDKQTANRLPTTQYSRNRLEEVTKLRKCVHKKNFGTAFQKSPFYFSGILQTAFAGLALSFPEKSIIRF